MSQQSRPVATILTICDFCDQPIDDREPGEAGSITSGSLTHGYGPRVELPRTRRAWLLWPPAGRDRRLSWEQRRAPENRNRRYDFHADCILRLVEDGIAAARAERETHA